ncbi:MAG TPA: O-antigen ligase family protein [Gaiellaceae bacterium]|nr:O-antigen ligase family protein [Gaiellaceae bacterium]
MATPPRTAAAALGPVPRGALVLAGALPLLFLHVDYQPKLALRLGDTPLDVKLSDLALAVIAVTALTAAVQARPRLRGFRLLLPGTLFLVLAFAGVLVGAASAGVYDTGAHLVSAFVWLEYATLALAVPLLVRGTGALRALLWSLAAATAVLDAAALTQFVGVDWAQASVPGARQPSLIGYHDFAAIGASSLAAGLALVALGRAELRQVATALCATGFAGTVLAGSVGAAAGLLLAATLVLVAARAAATLDRRRAATVCTVALAAVFGVLLLRGGDLGQFGRFLGLLPKEQTTTRDVQTYSHRALLVYLGLRVAADHPLVGAGWLATTEYETLAPYVPDAKARFPDIAAEAFPAPGRPHGVQNAYVQVLAELGPLGLLAFVGALALPLGAGLRTAARGSPAAVVGMGLLAVCAGVWSALGLVGGVPTLALTCIGVGLVVAARSAIPDG